ncbi:MAG: hypothetical protein KBC64_00270 [Simkaniaceae bacterium]|nr:hypothetical protein [Simkaniaceae bacterium]
MAPLNFYDRQELTCHLTDSEVGRLEIATSRVPPTSVDELCSDLRSEMPFQGEFWSRHPYKTWPLIAFAALKAERCTVDQFATISLLFAALKEFVYTETGYSMRSLTPVSWEIHHFCDKEECKDKKWRVISPLSPEYQKYLPVFFKGWNQQAYIQLHRRLAKLAPQDKCLFEVQMPQTPIEYWAPMIKAIKIATQEGLYPFVEEGINILGGAEKRKLILPAFPVVRLLSELMDADMPIFMIPRLGTMMESDIVKDRFRFSHVVALEMEEIPVPDRADGYPTGPFAFGWHDIYHTYTYGSSLTRSLLLATNRMIQVLTLSINDPILTMLRIKLIDGEFLNHLSIEGYLVGHLFNNPYLKDSWDAREGFYKKKILEDIATYRPFWDYICYDKVGLSVEDMALIPPHPGPRFPPDQELLDLGMGEDVLSLIKMAEALKWTTFQMRKGVTGLTGDDGTAHDRYRLCMYLFAHLPLEKSKEEIAFIEEAPSDHILYLNYWKYYLIQGKSAKTLSSILSPHFTLIFSGANLLRLSSLFEKSWENFEQLVNLLSRSHEKALNEGFFTLNELDLILNSGHRKVLGPLLEQTERCNWSKKELFAQLLVDDVILN